MESISDTMNGVRQPGLTTYAAYRPDLYLLLASLLNSPPTETVFHVLRNLQWENKLPYKLEFAFCAFRQVCREALLTDVQKEYDRLFVGLGAGEIIPYACWYLDKTIRSKPLAVLRADLMKCGIVQQAGCHDSEDHAGALCEIMAILAQKKNGVSYSGQSAFFQRHIASWMTNLFLDIRKITVADFYRLTGILGRSLMEMENEFLARMASEEITAGKGGIQHGHQRVEQPPNIS